jgi:hypothetical protein
MALKCGNGGSSRSGLTLEQKQRAASNREVALERRRASMAYDDDDDELCDMLIVNRSASRKSGARCVASLEEVCFV